MNVFVTLLAMTVLGTEANTNMIVPQGMDASQYLDVQFHQELILDDNYFGNDADYVVVYNAAGEIVAEGNATFIGAVVDADNAALQKAISKGDFMMEVGTTRIYQQ